MAQHSDYNAGNNTPALLRADINAILQAAVTNNSGSTAPPTTFPCMWWADTSASKLLKIRNVANTGWITVGSLDVDYLGLARANLGLTAAGVLFYNQTLGVFRTAPGSTAQVVTTTSNSRTSHTTYTRMDGFSSALTSAQGIELLTGTIATVQTTSKLRFDISLSIQPVASLLQAAVGLFKDGNTGPVSAAYMSLNGNDVVNVTFFADSSSSASATYKVRFGATTQNGASSDSFYFNAQPSALGTSVNSTLVITELSV